MRNSVLPSPVYLTCFHKTGTNLLGKILRDFSKKLEKDGKVPAHIRLLRDKDAKTQGVPIRDFMFIAGEKYSEINKY